MNNCPACGSNIKKATNKYCSNKCEATHKYKVYIAKWKLGSVDGSRGIITRNVSGHLRRFLTEKYGEKCVLCGWSKKHPVTGKVPLDVDHLDGNSENNFEANLRLICPNCHSLSLNYKNLNKGHGRKWRKDKYLKTP